MYSFFFFFNDTATTEIYTLSLHDALPISTGLPGRRALAPHSSRTARVAPRIPHRTPPRAAPVAPRWCRRRTVSGDRKSTRLNSSHDQISYAVFCLKKKKIEEFRRKGDTFT